MYSTCTDDTSRQKVVQKRGGEQKEKRVLCNKNGNYLISGYNVEGRLINDDTKIAINSWTNAHPSGGYVFPKMAN